MIKYIKGLIKNLFNPAVSIFALVDNHSIISKKAKINSTAKMIHSSIDDYSYIGKNSTIVYTTIGKYCSIADECNIGLGHHTLQYLSTSPIFTEVHNGTGQKWSPKNIVSPYSHIEIGNDVWIGFRSIIIGNIKIGDGVVIGAGSIVTKDVPPYAIVAGVPAKIIRYRFSDETLEKLEDIKWWDLEDGILKKNINIFQKKVSIDTLRFLKILRSH